MSFYGLFIGINNYKSKKINNLNFAKRDAQALYCLFSDTFENDEKDNIKLLIDEDATKDNINKELEVFLNCNEDDTVVIYFSGHGSETHELVVYDSDLINLKDTSISLEILSDIFSKIPAKKIILFLDCCFSGGMGAKVLKVDFKSKNIDSIDNIINKLSGQGRIIFTASNSDESAWEYLKLKHGIFTSHLIEALKGDEEIIDSGRIPFYKLIEYVSKKVTSSALQINKKQNPTFKGNIDEAFYLPVLIPKNKFSKYFPEYVKQEIDSDISSLSKLGFPIQLIDTWKENIQNFNNLQISAINEYGLLEEKHIIVSSPTSTGKTMIGELASLKGIIEGKRSIFLFPLKALVNDKLKTFKRVYGEKLGLKIIRATGDSNDDMENLSRGKYDICLMTYEKFTALILGLPHILEQVGTIIIDEVQMVTDQTRGINLEFILTLIKIKRNQGIEPQLILLSAVIGETNGFENWLSAKLLKQTERPVPLEEGIITYNCGFKYIDPETSETSISNRYIQRLHEKNSSQDWIKPLMEKLVLGENQQVILFRATKPEAIASANYLKMLGLPSAQNAIDLLPKGDPSRASRNLELCLSHGVAFHISDLNPLERLVIEEEFIKHDSKIRVIVATPTLAMGINTPAESVIIAGLTHHKGIPYSVAEYKNMIGRAGRLGYSQKGSSYIICTSFSDEQYYWNKYVLGNPEDLFSRFFEDGTDTRSLILRVLVSDKRNKAIGLTSEEINNFLEGSFGAYRKKILNPKWEFDKNELINSLSELELHKLVETKDGNHYTLTELGCLAGQSGVEVESIIRVIDALSSVDPINISEPTLLAVTQITKELDNVYFPFNSKGLSKEITTYYGSLKNQGIAHEVMSSLKININEDYIKRIKRTIACLFYITSTQLSEIEIFLTNHMRDKNISGSVRSSVNRTFDILPVVIRIAEILHPSLDLKQRAEKLLIRLENGIPASMFEIAKKIGTSLSRADYLNLLNSSIDNLEKLSESKDEYLLALLSNDKNKVTEIRDLLSKENEKENLLEFLLPIYEG
ncbi:MAG: caspase family protein [Candidatus Sericytochromatia bacterium]